MAATEFSTDLLLWLIFGASLTLIALAAFHDLALRLLPNWTSLGIATSGIALRLLDGQLPSSLAASCAVFLAAYLCWTRGWMGGGDVKLLAACSLLVSLSQVLPLIVLTTLCGGVLAMIYLALGKVLARTPLPLLMSRRRSGVLGLMRRVWHVECRRIIRRSSLPYGCAIAGATVILMFGPAGPLGK